MTSPEPARIPVVFREGILACPCPYHGKEPGERCRPSRSRGSAAPPCRYRLWVAQAAMNGGRWPEPARRLDGELRERFAAAVRWAVASGLFR